MKYNFISIKTKLMFKCFLVSSCCRFIRHTWIYVHKVQHFPQMFHVLIYEIAAVMSQPDDEADVCAGQCE